MKRLIVLAAGLALALAACAPIEPIITPTEVGPTAIIPPETATPIATAEPTETTAPGPTEEPTPTQIGLLEPLGRATVIVPSLNIRMGPLPFSSAAPIGQLHAGDTFEVWEVQAFDRETDAWMQYSSCPCEACNIWFSNSLTEAWWVAYCYDGVIFLDVEDTMYLPSPTTSGE